jgi:GH25 family lysozyme M1 (1,4-beta-N-acetylmuramidase)
MQPVAAVGTRCGGPALLGIDVSAYQTDFDWAGIRTRRPLRFGIAKASQGTRLDPAFVAHVKAMRAEGVVVGSYHGVAGATQADTMWRAIVAAGGLGANDLPPAIDVEGDHIDPAVVVALAKRLRALSGRTPLLYSNACGLTAMRARAELAALPVWLASPSIDACFPSIAICSDVGTPLFWQWSWGTDQPEQHADADGGYYDTNYFLGDERALQAFIVASAR